MQLVLYRQHQFYLLQNCVSETRSEAVNCQCGDIELVQDPAGLVYMNYPFVILVTGNILFTINAPP